MSVSTGKKSAAFGFLDGVFYFSVAVRRTERLVSTDLFGTWNYYACFRKRNPTAVNCKTTAIDILPQKLVETQQSSGASFMAKYESLLQHAPSRTIDFA